MKKDIEERYNIEIGSIIKISDKVYKIVTSREEFLLKEHSNLSLESTFAR